MAARTTAELKVSKLRGKLHDVIASRPEYADRLMLLLWLKGSNMDVASAETKLRNTLKWRLENNVDETVRLDYEKKIQDQIKVNLEGSTRDGVIVVTARVRDSDWRGIFEQFEIPQLRRFWRKFFADTEESVLQLNRKLHPDVSLATAESLQGVFFVSDAEDTPMWQLASPKLIWFHITIMIEAARYYPKIIQACLIYNASPMMRSALKLCKKVLGGPNFSIDYSSDTSVLEKYGLELDELVFKR